MQLDLAFRDRLKWAIELANSSQSAVARAVGVRPQSIQAWASGVTTNPSRTALEAAAQHLGVSYEWLAWGKGPMRKGEADPAQAAAPGPSTDQVLLAREWESRLAAALSLEELPDPVVTGDHGTTRLLWLSDDLGAIKALYVRAGGILDPSRARLWALSVARAAAPLVQGRRWVLLLAPLSEAQMSDKHLDILRREARVLGLEVIHVLSPEQAAAVLLGRDHLTKPEHEVSEADLSDLII